MFEAEFTKYSDAQELRASAERHFDWLCDNPPAKPLFFETAEQVTAWKNAWQEYTEQTQEAHIERELKRAAEKTQRIRMAEVLGITEVWFKIGNLAVATNSRKDIYITQWQGEELPDFSDFMANMVEGGDE
jgi:hypothetical protein